MTYKPKKCLACHSVFTPKTSRMLFCSVPCRFWSYVDRGAGSDACWPWTQAITPTTGYGAFTPKTKTSAAAHRLAYQLTNGDIEPGFYVCHSCDNRACCNPATCFSEPLKTTWMICGVKAASTIIPACKGERQGTTPRSLLKKQPSSRAHPN